MSTPRTLLNNAADRLPSPSGVALAIMELWQDDRTTVEQLAHLVQADPALSGRLLKLANSASLGSRPVTSINAAIIKVGLKTVGELAVAFSLIDKGHSNHCEAFDYLEFWSHSLLMGLLCRALGRRTNVAPPEDLFSCALMSRIGLLAFATIYPSEYSELLKAHPANLAAAERERFGFDHNELSAEMLSDFGLPNVLAEASKFHEQPNASGYTEGSRSAKLVHLFHLGYRLSDLCLSINSERDDEGDLRLPRAHQLNLSSDQVIEILKQSLTDWQEWSKTLDLPVIPLAQLPETEDDTRTVAASPESKPGLQALLVSTEGATQRLKSLLPKIGIQAHSCQDEKEMLRLALQLQPKLIFIGECRQQDRRIKLCELIRSTNWGKLVYLVAIIDDANSDKITAAFHSGIDTFIPSTIREEELNARIQPAHRLVALQTHWETDRAELRRIANALALSQRKTELLSLTDQLTELPNRRSAIADIERAWAMSDRAGLPLSIIMIDIDHFKRINDSLGHAAGDKTLVEVAKALRSDLRQDDRVYRIGGEEFLLLSSTSDIKQLIIAAERLRRRIAALHIDYEGQTIQVSISLGLARREASHQHYDALLSLADTALYEAKSSGRNRICYSHQQQIRLLGMPA
ncbi:GGDEF domain-containing protein [Lamprobacter modestohalophilus]|nr:GGDEF domain-containing protein [Lamprobacter modestohalophilus]